MAISVASERPELVDLAADALWQSGAAGVEEQPSADGVRLIGGFADGQHAQAAIDAAAAYGLAGVLAPIDDDGLDAWRAWAEPVRSGRFWITPSWVEAPVLAPGEEVLWIDPGRTFGSGSHPTTRLVLEQIQDLIAPGDRVADIGCGSGVLAVGAARCGAAEVIGIDLDPDSPAITHANADRNDVADRVQASTDSAALLAASGQRFAVVAANLLAPVVAELAPHLVALVAPGGALVVAGLLADRWEASIPALTPLQVHRIDQEDGWVAVVLTEPSADGR